MGSEMCIRDSPSQASFAQSLASACDSGARLFDESFAEFCARSDLPEFDFIGVHGIWSWISDENRSVIVDFVRRKLRVGGVLYISYNTLPGWAAFAPMRHLMTEHSEILGAEGRGIVSRIDGAIDFAEKLLALNPAYLRANPQVDERVKKIKEHNRHYLAHEYFNRDWHPMHFATMGACLEPAKLQYACSANYLDAIDAVNLTAEQQAFLNEIPDPMFRQTTRDFMVNQQFRKDYWVKGARRLNLIEQTAALKEQRVILTTPRADVTLKVTGALGEANLNEGIYTPILDLMADHKPRSLSEIESSVKKENISFIQLIQAVMALSGAGHLSAVQQAPKKTATKALNAHLMEKARGSSDVSFLASPVTGGGILVNRFQQLFLAAQQQGKKTPQNWAQSAWEILSSQGQRLIKEGKPIESAEENLRELTAQAQLFADKQLPILEQLKVSD